MKIQQTGYPFHIPNQQKSDRMDRFVSWMKYYNPGNPIETS